MSIIWAAQHARMHTNTMLLSPNTIATNINWQNSSKEKAAQ